MGRAAGRGGPVRSRTAHRNTGILPVWPASNVFGAVFGVIQRSATPPGAHATCRFPRSPSSRVSSRDTAEVTLKISRRDRSTDARDDLGSFRKYRAQFRDQNERNSNRDQEKGKKLSTGEDANERRIRFAKIFADDAEDCIKNKK
jgi:hypothetical protein